MDIGFSSIVEFQSLGSSVQSRSILIADPFDRLRISGMLHLMSQIGL